jgi:N-methylhydantoinase B
MFHPLPPAPCFLYAWPTFQAIETIYHAVSKILPNAVPACSGGDICSFVWWGVREESGEPWADGSPHPVGQGAHVDGDGGSSLLHHGESATRFSPTEVWESRNPWLVERVQLRPDSCGPGRNRGGLGVEMFFEMLEDAYVTAVIERTKTPPWALEGGGESQPNSCVIRYSDGSSASVAKATRLFVPKGARIELSTGGGGGYGPPSERESERVLSDVREGYVTEEHARLHYPHAFRDTDGA